MIALTRKKPKYVEKLFFFERKYVEKLENSLNGNGYATGYSSTPKIVQLFRLARLDHDITALGEEMFKRTINMCISHRWNSHAPPDHHQKHA
jgi:hypothetical protein